MTPIHTRISIGVAKPLRFLHVTDSHLISADERDSERKRELARQRREAYDKHGFDCAASTRRSTTPAAAMNRSCTPAT